MSSVLLQTREPTNINRQFIVYPYYTNGANNFFVCKNNTLYRLENDLSGVDHVIARDMGKQMVINAIDPAFITYWNNAYDGSPSDYTNLSVVRPGIARKFQILSVVQGADDDIGSGGNSYAYSAAMYNNIPFDVLGPNNTVNDVFVVGNSATTVNTNITENLPFGTFWVMNDPLVISYKFSDITTEKAIKNRIDETTFF
jgi:hypothetical protein